MDNIKKETRVLKISDEEKRIINSYRISSIKQNIDKAVITSEKDLLIKSNLIRK
jgi:hypothetical protein